MDPFTAARLRRTQWVIVAFWIEVFICLSLVDIHHSPEGKMSHGSCALGFLSALAHGIWITLDARILNRRVGAWRFLAFLFGPLAIWIWILTCYGRRALWMIPVSLAIYAVAFLTPWLVIISTWPEVTSSTFRP